MKNSKKTSNYNQSKYQEIVYKVSGDTVIAQPVKTGIQDRNYFVIKEGLKAGDVVVDGPYEAISKELEEGDKINITTQKQLFSAK